MHICTDKFEISVSGTSNNKTFAINLFDIGYLILLFFMFLLLPNGAFGKVESETLLKMWSMGL